MELRNIETKLARATTLPILPNVATQLLSLSDNPNTSIREYENVISRDAALATKMLRAANSTFFGGGGQITTLARALTQLGMNNVRSISMAVAFHSSLSSKGIDKRFNVAYFWQHSLAVACAAKLLACLTHSPYAEEAFIAGLLHDIGKLALCMFLPQEATLVYDAMDAQPSSYLTAEMATLHVSHQEIGYLAAQRWGLPDTYLTPIARHHKPIGENGEIDPVTCFVHAGNVIAYEVGLGFAALGSSTESDPIVMEFLALPEAQFDPLRLAVVHEVSKVSMQMGL